MARVPYVADDALVEPARHLVLDHPINLYRALANSPGGLESFSLLGQWIRFHSKLDPRLREIAILTVGALSVSDYEFSHHVKIGRDFGLSDADIEGVLRETRENASELGANERLVIKAVREITLDGALSDAATAELRSLLDEETFVEFVLIVGHYACVVRVLASLQIDVEPSYAQYLEQFPLKH
jgi:alkylhydroperoxidase family enzyme